jgi:hypothetical protein
MKVSNLTAFVNKENACAVIFKRPQLSLQSASDRQAIASRLDSALSPEHLHCDGEISAAEAGRKYRFLMGAALELKKLDPSIKLYEV